MSSPDTDNAPALPGFSALALDENVVRALTEVGYETPSPIQAATIPPLLEGRDVIGQAQTGTGKTAAFALPVLSRIDLKPGKPQALVLAPTRELAIQVAEAFQKYATYLPGFQVLPIYGGQSYGPQLQGLKRGAQIVVGTPGRIIDHLDKGTLDLSALKFVVLDEADEMLRMGFIDDVEKLLQATPAQRQVALFSATMPAPIRRIAQTYLNDPVEVTIKNKTTTAANIRQRYWWVSGVHKLDALTRILEAESFDAMIVFARTKSATEELASKLQARGFAAAAINGDMAQAQRERVIDQLKTGKLDILIATDVAARGLDVDRISHVLNYDIPHDTESYVHRIGRTGRAGRNGEAILFVTPRERNLLRQIERATRQPIEQMQLPTIEAVNDTRVNKFNQRIVDTLATGDLGLFQQLVEKFEQEHNVPAIEIAAALARIAQGDQPLLLEPPAKREYTERPPREFDRERNDRDFSDRRPVREGMRQPRAHVTETGKKTYRIEVGHEHGVKPGNIVGAIANEGGVDAKFIGRVSIRDDYSLIDLPDGMPAETFNHLKKVWVAQQQLQIREWDGTEQPQSGGGGGGAPRPRGNFRPQGARPGGGGGKPPRRKY
ncbi:DEAD/DEAH box helicase [Luteibacter aegosomatis]|uniref:DEAD/DEAH box helicase n=1 Tax=Luteibacter aegosomatis TaxID=2911537 RepID=UPI001FFACB25|nr:DEAD/DEAH box helicase [Luteibacter aegosomatis]UPG87144.1 DEAD/DEAH box helicase [Luteibacter aegosomatis]